MSQTPAVVDKKRDIRTLVQSDYIKAEIAKVLPKHLTADRMARVTLTAIIKTPKLLDCTPESLLQALMLCSQAGLEPDGRNAHLIPYGNTVQVIFDWKGLVSLARRNGVQNIAADIVCENDVFKFFRNAEGLQFEHEINYRKPRGEMFAAFCIWKDGDQFDGEVMTKAEIDGIRKRSKASGSGPWVTDYNEMAKKTVVRRSSKKWPLDAELAEAAMVDEENLGAAKPQFAADTAAAKAALFPESAAPQLEAPATDVDEVPMGGKTPQAPKPAQAGDHRDPTPAPAAGTLPPETPDQMVSRMLVEAKVSFDGFVAVIQARNISKDADSWATFEDVPKSVLELLAAQPKTLAEIIKKFGSNPPQAAK